MNIKLLVITLLASVFGGSLEAAPNKFSLANTFSLTNSSKGYIWFVLFYPSVLHSLSQEDLPSYMTNARFLAPNQTQEIPVPRPPVRFQFPRLAIWTSRPDSLKLVLTKEDRSGTFYSPQHLAYSPPPQGGATVARRGFKFVWNGTKLIAEKK